MEEYEEVTMSKTYNLFISHSWTYSDAYEKLVGLLDNAQNFNYKNYSVPKNDPIHNAANDKQLKAAIQKQMQSASVILILAGVYSSYSKWINTEIELAQNGFTYPKKIIAIEPWGAEKTSIKVKNAADEIVKWQTASIVAAIKKLG